MFLAKPKEKVPGFTKRLDVFDVEVYLKCPLRSLFLEKTPIDHRLQYRKAILTTINYGTSKFIMEHLANGVGISTNYINLTLKRLRNNVSSFVTDSNLHDSFIEKGSEVIQRFITTIEILSGGYFIELGPFDMDYIDNGVTISIPVICAVRKKTDPLSKLKYIYLDFIDDRTAEWNTFGRLWAAAIKKLLLQNGFTNIDTAVLSLPNSEADRSLNILNTRIESVSMVSTFLSSITQAIALHHVYPIFGGHCHACQFRTTCASVNSA